jgi:serine/threonine protein phosphatase PrpC/flagellar basal body-associated protein FliL
MINIQKDVFSDSVRGMVRQANEDNCRLTETPNGYLFVVCDGMGGHVGGATASKIAVDSIIDYFVRDVYPDPQNALAGALHFANMQIIATAQANPELKGMGTTACVVLIKDNKVWFAHVGDSRIYLFCNREQWLHRITKDHSFVQTLVDLPDGHPNKITDAEAEHHPQKNRILKALGIKADIEPEVCQAPVLPAENDIFLICSDGLSGMITDDDMQHVLLQNSSLDEKGNLLITLANQAGGTDNITVQLIRISQSPYSNSIFESKNPAERICAPKINGTSNTSEYAPNKAKKDNKVLKYLLIASIVLVVAIGGVIIFKPMENSGKSEQKIAPNTQEITENKSTEDNNVPSEATKQTAWEKIASDSSYTKKITTGFNTSSNIKEIYTKDNVTLEGCKDGCEGLVLYCDSTFLLVEKIKTSKDAGGSFKIETDGEVKKYDKNGNEQE